MAHVIKGEGLAVAHVGDTIISLWRDPAVGSRVKWQVEQVNAFAHSQPGDVLHMMLVPSTSDPPDAEGRALYQKHMVEIDGQKKLRQFIIVPLGNAVWANLVATIARTVLFIVRKSHLIKTCTSFDQGVKTLHQFAGPSTPNISDIKAAVNELEKALEIRVL